MTTISSSSSSSSSGLIQLQQTQPHKHYPRQIITHTVVSRGLGARGQWGNWMVSQNSQCYIVNHHTLWSSKWTEKNQILYVNGGRHMPQCPIPGNANANTKWVRLREYQNSPHSKLYQPRSDLWPSRSIPDELRSWTKHKINKRSMSKINSLTKLHIVFWYLFSKFVRMAK